MFAEHSALFEYSDSHKIFFSPINAYFNVCTVSVFPLDSSIYFCDYCRSGIFQQNSILLENVDL